MKETTCTLSINGSDDFLKKRQFFKDQMKLKTNAHARLQHTKLKEFNDEIHKRDILKCKLYDDLRKASDTEKFGFKTAWEEEDSKYMMKGAVENESSTYQKVSKTGDFLSYFNEVNKPKELESNESNNSIGNSSKLENRREKPTIARGQERNQIRHLNPNSDPIKDNNELNILLKSKNMMNTETDINNHQRLDILQNDMRNVIKIKKHRKHRIIPSPNILWFGLFGERQTPVKHSLESITSLLSAACHFLLLYDFKSSLEHLYMVIRKDPYNKGACLILGQLLHTQYEMKEIGFLYLTHAMDVYENAAIGVAHHFRTHKDSEGNVELDKAIAVYNFAAEHFKSNIANISLAYINGYEDKRLEEAERYENMMDYYRKSMKKNFGPAYFNYGVGTVTYSLRKSAEERRKSQEDAIDAFEKAGKYGDARGFYNLGYLKMFPLVGHASVDDKLKAFEYLCQANKLGHPCEKGHVDRVISSYYDEVRAKV